MLSEKFETDTKESVLSAHPAELATRLLTDADLPGELNALLDKKMLTGEAKTSAPWKGIHAFLKAELAEAMRYVPAQTGDKVPADAVNAFLKDAVLHFGGA